MSRLGCVCGHSIPDHTDNLSYKGYIIRDKHFEDLHIALDDMAAYSVAERDGKGQEWLIARIEEAYAQRQPNIAHVISTIWLRFFVKRKRDIYQCECCGRIWIQGENNHFFSFVPEKSDSQGVLDIK